MGGTYGMSQAAKLIQAGNYAEAISEATRDIARDEADPAPLAERAQAHALLGQNAEAVSDLEKAIALDAGEGAVDSDAVDDAYFSALLATARSEATTSVEAGVRRLARYKEVLPKGSHLKDAHDWQRRLRGELKSEFVKERE